MPIFAAIPLASPPTPPACADPFSAAAGELRAFKSAGGLVTILTGDVDGDGAADFRIKFAGDIALDIGDFIL